MSKDLTEIYRELEAENQTPEIIRIKAIVENKLNQRLTDSMTDLIDIGDVLGFGFLEKNLRIAADIVEKAKNIRNNQKS